MSASPRPGALRTLLGWLLLGPVLVLGYAWVLYWLWIIPVLWVPFAGAASLGLVAIARATRCTACSRHLALTLADRTYLHAAAQVGTELRGYYDEHMECLFCGHRTVRTVSSAGSLPCDDTFVRGPAAERLCWLLLWLACVGLTVLAFWFTWFRDAR